MATRYWVGGSGIWDATSTLHWSMVSGGGSGATAPSANDDVIFNASSGGGTITISAATCLSFNASGFTGTFTNNGAYKYISVKAGNVTLGGTFTPAKVGIDHNTGTTSGSFTANLASKPVYYSFISSNKTASITVSGTNMSGATDAYTAIAVQQANIATFSDATIAVPNNFIIDSCNSSSLGSGTIAAASISIIRNTTTSGSRSLTMSSSTGTVNANLQSSSGISSITVNGCPSCSLSAYTGTLPTILVTSCSGAVVLSGASSATVNSGTQLTIEGSNTGTITLGAGSTCPTVIVNTTAMSNLSTNTSVTSITINQNTTISTLNITGPAGTTTVKSFSTGSQVTITASSYSLSNITWKDINAAGNIPFTGTGFVDGGNNSNIQFAVPGNGLFFGSNF